MRVVIDTNVLISAFVFSGNAERSLEKALALGEVICSDFITGELTRVLLHKFSIPEEKVNRILATLNQVVQIVEPTTALPDVCRDTDDNYILQLAESVHADFIVTGDKDLLTLVKFGETRIVSPVEFLEIA